MKTRYSDGQKWYDGLNRPKDVLHSHSSFNVSLSNGADETVEIEGKVTGFLPLRNRRNNMHTYIGEGMTEYTIKTASGKNLPKEFRSLIGVLGMGISEYLDQNLKAKDEHDKSARL